MSRLAIISACCVVAAGTAAQAQVTNVTGASSTQVQLDSLFTSMGNGPGQFSQAGGAAYYSSYATTPSAITFESANASIRGQNQVSATSSSSVDITITNGGTAAVNPVLHSQITAAGLGMYLANTAGGCGGSGLFPSGDPFGGCGQTKGGQIFRDLPEPAGVAFGAPVAGASFQFTVTAGGTQVYNFTGTETMTEGDGFLVVNPLQVSTAGVLQGLTHITPGMAGSADGYSWGASNIDVALGGMLAAGASEDVVYTATVTTFSDVNCVAAATNVCLAPYAAFGDPIGRGGGTNVARLLAFGPDFGPIDTGSGGINFVDNWGPQRFQVPTFDFKNGILSFNGIPEPGTWMSMILGFGLLGAALRRRRVLGYT